MRLTSLVVRKLKDFRFTVPSLILLALASYRTLTSGYSIQMVGICASVVPFICQFRNFPEPADGVSERKEVLSNVILNLILMCLYLGYMLILTAVGKTFIPSYVVNPHFVDMLLIAVCANVVFIAALIPVCHVLKPMQRMMSGILLCNAQIAFMMMAADYVSKAAPEGIRGMACGFTALILALAAGFISLCYREQKQ